jgi:opacity protein-like surface antigen
MRTATSVLFGAVLLALSPTVSNAQDQRIHVNFGGGPTFISGNLGSHFNTGWGPALGLTIDFNKRLAFQFEYAYRWFDANGTLPVGATAFGANHQTHQLAFNFVANVTHPDSAVRAYIIAGPGAYHRAVDITQYQGTGVICDPFWYVCGYYPVTAVIGSRGGWDFGFSVGGGVGFKIGDASEFYIESRYHYVVGPDVNLDPAYPGPVGTTLQGGSTTGHYVPLTFGFRF